MSDSAGKTARVIGTFVLMIGTGMVLDRSEITAGITVMFIGWAAFVWGLLVLYHKRSSKGRSERAMPPASGETRMDNEPQ